jgi:hypothetical protein
MGSCFANDLVCPIQALFWLEWARASPMTWCPIQALFWLEWARASPMTWCPIQALFWLEWARASPMTWCPIQALFWLEWARASPMTWCAPFKPSFGLSGQALRKGPRSTPPITFVSPTRRFTLQCSPARAKLKRNLNQEDSPNASPFLLQLKGSQDPLRLTRVVQFFPISRCRRHRSERQPSLPLRTHE